MRYNTLGKIYGYPDCCITEFCAHVSNGTFMSRSKRKLIGTGYIPCLECNNKYSVEELVENINKNRDISIPAFSITR